MPTQTDKTNSVMTKTKSNFLKKEIVTVDNATLKTYTTTISYKKTTLVFVNALAMPFDIAEAFLLKMEHEYNIITYINIVAYTNKGISNLEKLKNMDVGINQHINDLLAVINHYNLGNKKIVLCGWYTGCNIIIEFVIRFPENVRQMIFINGFFSILNSELFTSYERAMLTYCKGIYKSLEIASAYQESFFSKEQFLALSEKFGTVNPNFTTQLYAPFSSGINFYIYANTLLSIVDDSFDNWEYKINSRCIPIFIIASTKDKTASYPSSELLYRIIKNARNKFYSVKGGNHCSPFEIEFSQSIVNEIHKFLS